MIALAIVQKSTPIKAAPAPTIAPTVKAAHSPAVGSGTLEETDAGSEYPPTSQRRPRRP